MGNKPKDPTIKINPGNTQISYETPEILNLIIFFKGILITMNNKIGMKKNKNTLGTSLFFHNHNLLNKKALINLNPFPQIQNLINLLTLIFLHSDLPSYFLMQL